MFLFNNVDHSNILFLSSSLTTIVSLQNLVAEHHRYFDFSNLQLQKWLYRRNFNAKMHAKKFSTAVLNYPQFLLYIKFLVNYYKLSQKPGLYNICFTRRPSSDHNSTQPFARCYRQFWEENSLTCLPILGLERRQQNLPF